MTTREFNPRTADFNATVWKHVDAELLNSLPLDQIEPVPPRIVGTVFQGAVTEITVLAPDALIATPTRAARITEESGAPPPSISQVPRQAPEA